MLPARERQRTWGGRVEEKEWGIGHQKNYTGLNPLRGLSAGGMLTAGRGGAPERKCGHAIFPYGKGNRTQG